PGLPANSQMGLTVGAGTAAIVGPHGHHPRPAPSRSAGPLGPAGGTGGRRSLPGRRGGGPVSSSSPSPAGGARGGDAAVVRPERLGADPQRPRQPVLRRRHP